MPSGGQQSTNRWRRLSSSCRRKPRRPQPHRYPERGQGWMALLCLKPLAGRSLGRRWPAVAGGISRSAAEIVGARHAWTRRGCWGPGRARIRRGTGARPCLRRAIRRRNCPQCRRMGLPRNWRSGRGLGGGRRKAVRNLLSRRPSGVRRRNPLRYVHAHLRSSFQALAQGKTRG